MVTQDMSAHEICKARLANSAEAILKEDVKAKRKTPYVSIASELRCLDVMASRPVAKRGRG